MKKRIRVSYNLKPETIELVKKASEIFNEDMSSIVDQALTFRLKYINDLKPKTKYTNDQKALIKKYNLIEEDIEAFFEWYNKQPQDQRNYVDWIWCDYMVNKYQPNKDK